MNRWIAAWVCAGLLACLAGRSWAVCKAPIPVSKSYSSARNVIVGKVTKYNAEAGTIEAAATTLRGPGLGEILRIKLEGLPEVAAKVKEGAPLVLFTAAREKNYALHLADTWLLPIPSPANPGLFRVAQTSEAALRQSYPGTTAALVRLVDELKAEKTPMLDEVSPEMFKGGIKDLGKLPGGPFTSVFGFRAGGKSYLAAVSGGATAVFEPAASGFQPAGSVQPPSPRLSPEKVGADPKALVGLAEGDFGDDASPAIMAIKEDAIIRLPDNGDFTRMTGEHLSTYFREPRPLAAARICTIDCNGDGRMDLVIATPARTMLLINRGYGAFFVNADLAKLMIDGSGKPLLGEDARLAGVDVDGDGLDDLVIVSKTGAVSALMNPRPGK